MFRHDHDLTRETSMRFSDMEINNVVRHLYAVGYKLLTYRERRIVDALCAIC